MLYNINGAMQNEFLFENGHVPHFCSDPIDRNIHCDSDQICTIGSGHSRVNK